MTHPTCLTRSSTRCRNATSRTAASCGAEAWWSQTGPFDAQSDPTYRGMSIFAYDTVEAARLSDGDPSVIAGRLAYDVMEWWVHPGSLAFPLADRLVGERRSMPDD